MSPGNFLFASSLLVFTSPLLPAAGEEAALVAALTFHASFDHGLDADFAKGDRRLHTLTDREKMIAEPGLHTGGKSVREESGGRFGGALRFTAGDAPWIFFPARDNLPYAARDWSGSVSLWLKCDPRDGLAEGYCDPVQLTPRAWNDAAFFLDFNKEGKPRDFRLGAFADRAVWNPEGGEVAEAERPLLTARAPGFAADKWIHVVFTWEGFNTGSKDAVAILYLNGARNGTLTGWNQQFTWSMDETPRLLLGLHYVGMLDEFSCFDRALNATEINRLHALKDGLTPLLAP